MIDTRLALASTYEGAMTLAGKAYLSQYQQNPSYTLVARQSFKKQVIVGTNFTDLGKRHSFILLRVQGLGTRQT